MNNTEEAELSLVARVGFGLLLVVGGASGIMASFHLGPLSSAEVNGPRWLAAAAGGVFFLAGLSVAAGPRWRQHPISHGIGFLIVAGLAAIGNWIALGPGLQGCRAAWSGLTSGAGIWVLGLGGCAAFGVGAMVMDGIVLWMVATGVGKALGPGRLSGSIEKLGESVLLLSLSPILVPLVLGLVFKVLIGVVRDRIRHGEWPRNEAFIARMKRRPPGPQ